MVSRVARMRLGLLVLVWICLASDELLPRCLAEEAVWQFEKLRVETALCEGDFRKAIELANTFEKEFDRARKSYKAKSRWQLHEWVAIDSDLLIGTVERICGNYGRAKMRFEQALAELKQIRLRNLRAFASASAREQLARNDGVRLQAAALDQESAVTWLAGEIQHQIAGQAASSARNASDIVYQTETRMIEVNSALGSLAIDSSLPLGPHSAKLLREAEGFFRAAQEASEKSGFGAGGGRSVHGTHKVTFFVNYGNIYLKRAESRMRVPDLPPVDESVDLLLERAADYLDQAEDEFSGFKSFVDKYKGLVHNGEVADLKDRVVRQLVSERPELSRGAVRRDVDNAFLEFQMLCLGDADINFKQSELAIVRVMNDDKANPARIGPQERAEQFDEAEQRLLDAADKIKLISSKEDHPFLVTCYSELVILEATRAKQQGRKPDAEYADFLGMAENVMKAKELHPDSVQGVYLSTAKQLWRAAGG